MLALNVAITQVEPVMHGDDTVPFLLTIERGDLNCVRLNCFCNVHVFSTGMLSCVF